MPYFLIFSFLIFKLIFTGKTHTDFGEACHGFYLGRSIEFTHQWVREKFVRDVGAILIFEVPDASSFFEKFTGIDLNIPDDDGSADSPALERWKEVVSFYRNNQIFSLKPTSTTPECLRTLCQDLGIDCDIDYIIGPISNVGTQLPISRRPEKSQLCIKSYKLARRFPFLTSILFFKI